MIEVWCIVRATGERFTKYFDSPYLANNFIRKCNYGNKIIIEGWCGM